VIAGLETLNVCTHLDDRSGRLVTEHRRAWNLEHTVQVVQITVTESGRRRANQNLVRAHLTD
jgi:hypothetical protein